MKDADFSRIASEHPLATQEGLDVFIALLVYSGVMCPKCGYGTRVTSKRWAKCKRCGTRTERVPLSQLELELEETQ